MFLIKEKISLSGNGVYNEDGYFISPSLCCVMDGATSIKNIPHNSYASLAEWFVHSIIDYFEKNYKNDFFVCLKNALRYISKDDSLDNVDHELFPSVTIASVELIKNNINIYVLGDCHIIIKLSNGYIKHITDIRVDKYSKLTFDKYKNAKLYNKNHNQEMYQQMIENKHMMNKKNGYWTVTLDGNFFEEFIKLNFKVNEVESILICSDGFFRIYKEFNLLNYRDFFLKQYSLHELSIKIREYEKNFYDKDNFPCIKRHDDLTAINILVK